jgi:hypothetical protein
MGLHAKCGEGTISMFIILASGIPRFSTAAQGLRIKDFVEAKSLMAKDKWVG